MKKLLLPALPVLLLLLHAAAFVPYIIDDAYITYTCTRNLVAGAGPVFVPGERVEATSSFLWALALAPFEASGIGAPVGSKILGALCAIATIVVAMNLFGRMRPGAGAAQHIAVGVLIAGSSPFVLWASYGMENGLAALLLVCSVLLFGQELAANRGWRSAVPILLLETVRPEGFIFVALFIVLRLMWAGLHREHRRALLWPWLAVLLLPLLAYEAWGYLYYGHLLPNPVAAKVRTSIFARLKDGALYVLRGRSSVLTYTFLASCLIALPALFARRHSIGPRGLLAEWRGNPWYLVAFGVVALQMSFAIGVGGDWMPNGRFISHVAPLVMVTLVCGYSMLAEHAAAVAAELPGMRIVLRAAAVVILIGLVGYNAHTSERSVHGPVGELQESEDRALGGTLAFLDSAARPTDVVACSDIGRIGYYFKGTVFDWWGLANEEITGLHQAMGNIDPATVLKYRPRYIVIYSTEPTLTPQTTDYGMAEYSRPFLRSPDFMEHYRPVYSVKFSKRRYHITYERVQ